MTKADFVKLINEQAGFSKADSFGLVEQILEIIKETLVKGEKIKIAGFGNFEVRLKNDRRGRNPLTGETITIEARRVLTFKPSVLLKQKMNHTI
jgi:integration host factor subunit alpha